jgi:hypothetical protein
LSELVSAFSPTQLTEIALVLFLAVFAGVAIRHGRKRAEHAHCASLPLEDDK